MNIVSRFLLLRSIGPYGRIEGARCLSMSVVYYGREEFLRLMTYMDVSDPSRFFCCSFAFASNAHSALMIRMCMSCSELLHLESMLFF